MMPTTFERVFVNKNASIITQFYACRINQLLIVTKLIIQMNLFDDNRNIYSVLERVRQALVINRFPN